MRWSSVLRETHLPGRTPRVRERNPSGTRAAGAERTAAPGTDSGSTTGARGGGGRPGTPPRASGAPRRGGGGSGGRGGGGGGRMRGGPAHLKKKPDIRFKRVREVGGGALRITPPAGPRGGGPQETPPGQERAGANRPRCHEPRFGHAPRRGRARGPPRHPPLRERRLDPGKR